MNIRPYIIAALAALSVSPAITAQKKGTDFTEHLDQKVITEGNAVTRRHETIFFNTVKDALSKEIEASPNYSSLNGVWDFRYYDSVQDMLADPDKAPTAIKVPGN